MGQKPGTRLGSTSTRAALEDAGGGVEDGATSCKSACVSLLCHHVAHWGEGGVAGAELQRRSQDCTPCRYMWPGKSHVTQLLFMQMASWKLLNLSPIFSEFFFCITGQEQRRQEAGVNRSEELPQSMKISERVTRTATMSETKLYQARERADGLK